jgi:cell division protein FtsB
MRNFQQKGRWRNIMQSKIVLILLGIVILIFAWNVLSFWNKMRETEKNKEIVEEKIALLKQQKENYSSEIENLKTDKGKEKFFRESLGLAKDGEGLIIVVEDKNPPVAPASSSGFWSFLKNLFK